MFLELMGWCSDTEETLHILRLISLACLTQNSFECGDSIFFPQWLCITFSFTITLELTTSSIAQFIDPLPTLHKSRFYNHYYITNTPIELEVPGALPETRRKIKTLHSSVHTGKLNKV